MSTESATVPIWSFARRVDRRGREDSELLSVYRDHGVVPKSSRDDNFNKESEDLSNYLYVEQGDLVLNKMKTWQGSLAVSKFEGIVSPAYFVCQLSPQVEPRFIHYLLRAEPLIAEYAKRSKGIRPNQWDLPFDEFKAIEVTLPPVEEQQRIADFLDDQVARIDHALTLKVEQSTQLEEARVSRMTAAILSSTDNVVQLRRVLARRPEYGANEAAEFEESSWPRYIRTTDVTPEGELRAETFRSLPPDVAEPYLLADGDVLFTRSGATVGKSFIYREAWGVAAYAGYLIRVTADRSRVLPEWIKAFSETATYWDQIGENAIQATIQNVSADRYSSLLVPVPDVPTQRSLVSQFAEWTEATRSLARETERSLGLLEERKRALITVAVTGELDVTTAKPIGMGKWVSNVGASVEAPAAAQASSIRGIG